MTDRKATCSCGNLVVRTRGEPIRVSICHCLACQKRTGSVFGMQARFPLDAVTIEGQSREYAQAGDSGSIARFLFCGDCGATVQEKVSGTISDISRGFRCKQILPDTIDERRESCIAPAWLQHHSLGEQRLTLRADAARGATRRDRKAKRCQGQFGGGRA